MARDFTRRDFLRRTALTGAALGLASEFIDRSSCADSGGPASFSERRHPVCRDHPRLFGSRSELEALARQRTAEYQRVRNVARDEQADDYAWIISAALVSAIEADSALAKRVQQRAMKLVTGPIRVGHVPFGTDLALCGIAFDLCAESWPEADRLRLCEYVNKTVDANVNSETHVFHNAWYGYKNWGIGVACYATYHENERAPAILQGLEQDYLTRAAPALELAGEGGGWAEGYYVHYWLYEWLFFCEVARRCEGVDYYAAAPKFYGQRALASMFETLPGVSEYGSRRCVAMGDGGGRLFGGDRDKTLTARRLLVSRFRQDPLHQSIHAFNEITPRVSVGNYAYKDLLWHDAAIAPRDLKRAPLSHVSRGPGYVYARSSWDDDATHFFFKCGNRFTAHQHLDVNHFLLFKYAELAGDGGHYDEFGTLHDVNYHLRSIAHNTVLVLDPEERWPSIRGGEVTSNDGGQHHSWQHHNGALADPADWEKQRAQCHIADLCAFEDRGDYLYVAGDATRAYSPRKLRHFTRQILYVRPDTFVIFDRVKSSEPGFKKTWLLQAMRIPEKTEPHLVITNGKGRLFVQTLLPERPEVRLISGEDLYFVNGRTYRPRRITGPAPECRIEISPVRVAASDFFLHVLTVADAQKASVPSARAVVNQRSARVELGPLEIEFRLKEVGGEISLRGQRHPLADSI
jgi:hypothetical protein